MYIMTEIPFKYMLSMTDEALAKRIGAFVRHHRMEQHKTQEELATAAGISKNKGFLLLIEARWCMGA